MEREPGRRREISLQEFVLARWWDLWDDGAPCEGGEDHDPLDGREATTLLVFEEDQELVITRYTTTDDDWWLMALIATALTEQNAFSAD